MEPNATSEERKRARAEAAQLIRLVAPKTPGVSTTKERIYIAAHLLGWRVSRVREIWNATARRIESFEMDHLRVIGSLRESEFSDLD